MRQFLFVVNNGRIAFWQFHRGCLTRRSLNGIAWNDYCSAFWEEWSEANQPEDSEDATLLSDRPDAYGELPRWFCGSATQASKWTLETFSKIVNDEEFTGKGVKIYLGNKKYVFSSGSPEEVFWLYPRQGDLSSQFAAAKEKQIKRAMAEDQEKRRVAEELKKREAELVRKRVEEERRVEAAKRAAEEKRKRRAELRQKCAEKEARRGEDQRKICGEGLGFLGKQEQTEITNGSQTSTQGDVEFWLSRVGKSSKAALRVLVDTLPTAKKFPDWALGQVREVERLGVPMCLERKFDAAAAQKVIAKLRTIGADGYVRFPTPVKTVEPEKCTASAPTNLVNPKSETTSSPQSSPRETVEVWLSRVGRDPKSVCQVLIATLPTAKKFPDWVRGQVKEVERLGAPMCMEREVNKFLAQQVLRELRSVGADGYSRM